MTLRGGEPLPVYSHVCKIEEIYTVDQGCTRPARIILDDSRRAVLKYPHNPQGIIVLFNEYITYQIADILNLSIPRFGIAVVDETTSFDDVSPSDMNLQGNGFYCEYIPNAIPVSERVAKHASNLNETCKAILLDAIVKNSDRYVANALISFHNSDGKIYFIDHSHALGDPDWDRTSLIIGDYESPYVWEENRDFYEMLARAGATISSEMLKIESKLFQEKITGNFLDTIFSNTPEDWIPQIGIDNIQHAKQYITNRVENLGKICEIISKERGV